MSILYRVLCDGVPLLDPTVPGCDAVEAELTWEINDGMFEGTLRLKLFADHPNFDAVKLKKSTITAYEISDGTEREKFRGQAISIDDSLDAQKEITCEGDLKFLLDVPDIFSDKDAGDRQQYYIGTEDGFQSENMTAIPPMDPNNPLSWRFTYATPSQYRDRYEACQLTRFGENQEYTVVRDGEPETKYVTRNEVRTDAAMFAPEGTYGLQPISFDLDWGKRFGLYGGQAGNSRYTDYWIGFGAANRPWDQLTVDWQSDDGSIHTYILPLQRFSYHYHYYDMQSSPWSRVYIPEAVKKRHSTGYFIGNFGLISNNGWVEGSDFDGTLAVKKDDGEVMLSDVPFCIVHYESAMHWYAYAPKVDGTPALYYTRANPEDIIYAIPEKSGSTTLTSARLRLHAGGGANASQIAMSILQKPGDTYQYYETFATEADAMDGKLYLKGIMNLPETETLEASSYFSSLFDPRVTYYSGNNPSDVRPADPQPENGEDVNAAYMGGTPYYAEVANNAGTARRYVRVPFDSGVYQSRELTYYRREKKDLVGYNAYVPESRRLYRGTLEVNGEVDNTSVGNCYDAIKRVIDASGGYARTVRRGEYYVVDITQDSGVESDDFYVRLGENLNEAKQTLSCDGIVTGIYPVGVGKDGEQDLTPYTLRELDAPTAETIFDMTDRIQKYRYVGGGESWFKNDPSSSSIRYDKWYYRHAGETLTPYDPFFDDEWENIRYAENDAAAQTKEYIYMIGGTLYRYSSDSGQWEEYIPQEGDHYGAPVCAKDLDTIRESGDTTKTYATGGVVKRYTGGAWVACLETSSDENYSGLRNVYPAASIGDMTDTAKWYYIIGDSTRYWKYNSSENKFESHSTDGYEYADATAVSSPEEFTNRGDVYKITDMPSTTFRKNNYYYYDSQRMAWTEYKEAKGIHDSDGYTHDNRLGVVWHDEARNAYGSIIDYVEYDISHVPEGIRLQYLITQSEMELRNRLTAFESLDISAIDPRLIGLTGGMPVLGNYYKVTIPWLRIEDYKRLTKIVTDMVIPGGSKLTFGQKRNTLSDYVAKKGERL